MKISFEKVGSTPKPFSLKHNDLEMGGSLVKSAHHEVKLNAHISGHISMVCDRCGEGYTHIMDDKIELLLTDQIAQDKDDLDIIEFLDGMIDMDYIIESEINAIEGDFHYCSSCADSGVPLEIEF